MIETYIIISDKMEAMPRVAEGEKVTDSLWVWGGVEHMETLVEWVIVEGSALSLKMAYCCQYFHFKTELAKHFCAVL